MGHTFNNAAACWVAVCDRNAVSIKGDKLGVYIIGARDTALFQRGQLL